MPLPWLGVLAGTLAAKMASGDARKNLSASLMRRQADRLGGNTDMVDAIQGRNEIANQEGQQLSNVFGSLVGQLGQKKPEVPGTDVTTSKLGGAVGQTGLFEDPNDPYSKRLVAPGLGMGMAPGRRR